MPSALPLQVGGLETRLRMSQGTLTGSDLESAQQYIFDATAFALAEVPDDTQIAWQNECPDVVVAVIYKAARREFENPSGLSQEISGEHTITTGATSGVYLTQNEIAQVRRAAGIAGAGFVGTVTLGPPMTPYYTDPITGRHI